MAYITYNIPVVITVFAIFSFLGYVFECIVIRKEKGYFENRGMARGPFLPIYGFAVMIFFPVFEPIEHSPLLIFLLGGILATVFELIVGKITLALFGKLWWDYSDKFLNYKGIICAKSAFGWGILSILIITFVLEWIWRIVELIPLPIVQTVGVVFPLVYFLDFTYHMYTHNKGGFDETEDE